MALALLAAPSGRGVAVAAAAVLLFLMRRPWQTAWASRDPARASQARRVLVAIGLPGVVIGGAALMPVLQVCAIPLVVAAVGATLFAWFDGRQDAREALPECAGAAVFASLAAVVVLASGRGHGVGELAMAVGGFAWARSLTSILPVRAYVRRRKGQRVNVVPALGVSIAFLAAGLLFCVTRTCEFPLVVLWLGVFAARTAWLLGPWRPDWPARRIGVLEMLLGLAAVVTTGLSLS